MEKFLIKEIIYPLAIILGGFLLYAILVNTIKKLFKLKKVNNKKQTTIINLIINIVRYVIIIIALLMILEVYGIDTKSLLASLGIMGLILGLALQDLIKDFIAGMSIVFEDYYNVGDIITVNGFKGEVLELGIKTTRLKSYEGDLKVINNGAIKEIINHSVLDSLALIDVEVSYNSDLKKVEKVLTSFCDKMTKELDNLKENVTLLGVQKLGESGIVFRLTALVDNGMQYEIQRKILKEIKLEFEKNDIEISYPHVVIKHD